MTLLALAAGGLSSLLIVAATTRGGLASMQVLFWAIGLPGMLLVFAIGGYAHFAEYPRLANRIAVGVLGGIALTAALEVVRSAGVHLGYLSDDEPTMFGAMITGADHMAAPTLASYTLGIVYHFFNGISFALVYSIVFGRTRWWGPVAFSVFVVWVGMMLLPPMAPMLGAFGTGKYASAWNPYVADTLLAHIAMGLALAAVMHGLARDRGLLLAPRTLPGVHHPPAHAHPST
ncbi:hypothetical protein ACH4OQ_39075 [Streptomyces luteogriseus]|uniref:hypothetical protein n=1 Tax=Streptomyces luteogriseus TaxID=68233 RepID=UPI003790E61C